MTVIVVGIICSYIAADSKVKQKYKHRHDTEKQHKIKILLFYQ